MIPLIKFGTLLHRAISDYHMQNYDEANSFIDQALGINQFDFLANFWKVRTLVMQGKFEEAMNFMTVCRESKSAVKLENLLAPWESLCRKQTNQDYIDLAALNNETDDLLAYYQHHRTFRFLDLIYAVLLFIGSGVLTDIYQTVLLNSSELTAMTKGFIIALIYALAISYYYYHKTIIVPNIYISLQNSVYRILKLCNSKTFIKAVSFLIIAQIVIVIVFKDLLRALPEGVNVNHIFHLIGIILVIPILEEIVMRGILYGNLQKYGKALAWTVVTMVFYSYHLDTASWWHIFLSLLCLWVYDREKTILAPIMIHILNNGLSVLFTVLCILY